MSNNSFIINTEKNSYTIYCSSDINLHKYANIDALLEQPNDKEFTTSFLTKMKNDKDTYSFGHQYFSGDENNLFKSISVDRRGIILCCLILNDTIDTYSKYAYTTKVSVSKAHPLLNELYDLTGIIKFLLHNFKELQDFCDKLEKDRVEKIGKSIMENEQNSTDHILEIKETNNDSNLMENLIETNKHQSILAPFTTNNTYYGLKDIAQKKDTTISSQLVSLIIDYLETKNFTKEQKHAWSNLLISVANVEQLSDIDNVIINTNALKETMEKIDEKN